MKDSGKKACQIPLSLLDGVIREAFLVDRFEYEHAIQFDLFLNRTNTRRGDRLGGVAGQIQSRKTFLFGSDIKSECKLIMLERLNKMYGKVLISLCGADHAFRALSFSYLEFGKTTVFGHLLECCALRGRHTGYPLDGMNT